MNNLHPAIGVRHRDEKVHGEYLTTGTGGEIVLYDTDGAAVTVGANDRLLVTGYHLHVAAAGAAFINIGADGTPSAGEYLVHSTVPAGGPPLEKHLGTDPYLGIKAGKPFVTAASGAISCVITGYIKRGTGA